MTSTIKRIVCLANSRRNRERCIAGKELLADGRFGVWVRPVSARPSEEVSELERRYQDGGEPQLLDIIDVPLIEARPIYYQQENWLLDPQHRWQKVGSVSTDELGRLIDSIGVLWVDGDSSGSGQNDRIPFWDATSLDSSLCLIHVDSLSVAVSPPNREDGLPVLRGHFRHNGSDYSLRITDPDSESRATTLEYGNYQVAERYLTVSLGGPLGGYSYKLIANIIRP